MKRAVPNRPARPPATRQGGRGTATSAAISNAIARSRSRTDVAVVDTPATILAKAAASKLP